MILELREYRCHPEKRDQVLQRFRRHTFALFEKHAMVLHGFWVDVEHDDVIVYMLEFEDENARARAWERFSQDPAWHTAKRSSERSGPLVLSVTTRLLALVTREP